MDGKKLTGDRASRKEGSKVGAMRTSNAHVLAHPHKIFSNIAHAHIRMRGVIKYNKIRI